MPGQNYWKLGRTQQTPTLPLSVGTIDDIRSNIHGIHDDIGLIQPSFHWARMESTDLEELTLRMDKAGEAAQDGLIPLLPLRFLV